ncbi:FKBP-type peptidyl-prolyl cis-trans isomerase [Rubricoccus marinus]|uniref:Peptidyl-prolyl cis-trans isomerase n=1 Tax=Rubricoccus marinus TaxID=716817 RepID=A0A259TX53_9BACT|nr:FKBP-type peptidyl-prolyl cis-trans isomerase [Rubricoccus marinus]OZC02345.1 hypothetical protein BSZ36_04750 [Rubricoccus marinus]
MTFRILPFALAALLVVGVGCGDNATTGGASGDDLSEMNAFEQLAYALGFEAAQGVKADSASFKFFEFATFEEGFRDGLNADSSRLAYLFGYEMGNRLGRDTTANLDAEIFLRAFRAGLDSDSSGLSDEDLQRISTTVQDSISIRQLRQQALTDTSAQRMLRDMGTNAAAATRFLGEVAGRSGVTKTSSGLLYTVEETGSGASPSAADMVVVNYVGKLADGTIFDQSTDGTATFALAQVAPGFREGVMGMKVGGKRTLYLPPDLGYGQQGTPGGPIPPNAALVFEVELLDVQPMQQNMQMQLPPQ